MPNLCKFVTEDKGDRSAMIEVPPNETDGEKGPAPRTGLPLLRVAILLCPDFTLTLMASFVDALRLAADRRDDSRQVYFAWDYYSTSGTSPVSSSGLPVASLAEPSNLDAYDCVVVCGGLIRCLPAIRPEVLETLRRAARRGATVVGLCTGSFVLAEAGLLDGRRCAVHFHALSEFLQRFPTIQAVANENHVIDGQFITCPGSIVAIEVATHLISKAGAQGRAQKAANFLLFRPEEGRITLKARPYEETLQTASALTQAAVQFMETRLDTPCSVDELAKRLHTTKSKLHRSFLRDLAVAPAEFWRTIRLQAACDLLLHKRLSVTEIAYGLGFSDTAHFCNAFKSHFGRSPREFARHGATRPGRSV